MDNDFKPVGITILMHWILSKFRDDTKSLDLVTHPSLEEVGKVNFKDTKCTAQQKYFVKRQVKRRSDRHH